MKKLLFLLLMAIGTAGMAQTALMQSQLDSLKTDPVFLNYLGDQIMNKVANYKGMSSASDLQTVKNIVYARYLAVNGQVVYGDSNLTQFIIISMITRGLANGDNGTSGSATKKSIAYLNGSNRYGFLVDDYFLEKTKNY